MKKIKYLFLLLVFAVAIPSQVLAHPGRTDSSGGHTCRTNCEQYGLEYGEYHYHNGGGSSTPSSSSPTLTPTPAPTPAPRPVAQPKPAPKKTIETINSLITSSTANVLWVDLILAEVSRGATTTSYTTVNPLVAATSRITGATQEPKVDGAQKSYYVNEVTDGDTIKVVIDGRIEKVRLLGIDTPETKDPRKPVQCFGMEASKYAASLMLNKYVRLEVDKTQGNKDRYNRLLRYVYLENGTEVNEKLVEQGYALAYLRYPVAKTERYKKLQSSAESNNLGLWSACR
jgi:endonuclease YncB( thermonuclease family)